MGAPILDNEFMEYWSRLTVVQKESLLLVAKNYVKADELTESTIDLRKKMILEDKQNYLQGVGTSVTWEQVKDMAINTEKRDGL